MYTSKEHIIAALKKGVRLDGRKPDQFRPLSIKIGTIETAEGSAIVKCGDTEVIVGVKMAIGKPYADRPNSGTLMVGAELLPISNPMFEQGPPTTESIELARIIDKGIRESKSIDESSLCITPGEKVWMVNVDICPLNTDGNLIDVGALAAIAALKTTRLPKIDENGTVNYKSKTDERLPVEGIPLPVTIIKVGDVLLVDATNEEFAAADARLTIITEEDGTICALQKGGDSSLTLHDISEMIDLATHKAKELRALLTKAMK
jgi:exosome complex component RRP42